MSDRRRRRIDEPSLALRTMSNRGTLISSMPAASTAIARAGLTALNAPPRIRLASAFQRVPALRNRMMNVAEISAIALRLRPLLHLRYMSTGLCDQARARRTTTVSYTHLRAHETRHDLVCRL